MIKEENLKKTRISSQPLAHCTGRMCHERQYFILYMAHDASATRRPSCERARELYLIRVRDRDIRIEVESETAIFG